MVHRNVLNHIEEGEQPTTFTVSGGGRSGMPKFVHSLAGPGALLIPTTHEGIPFLRRILYVSYCERSSSEVTPVSSTPRYLEGPIQFFFNAITLIGLKVPRKCACLRELVSPCQTTPYMGIKGGDRSNFRNHALLERGKADRSSKHGRYEHKKKREGMNLRNHALCGWGKAESSSKHVLYKRIWAGETELYQKPRLILVDQTGCFSKDVIFGGIS